MSRAETLLFLNLAHFADHLFLLIFPVVAIAVAGDWGMGYGEVLTYGTPLYVMFAVGTLPAGWLGDRFDRTLLIALFFIGCGASSLLVGFSTGATSLMLGLALLGLFTALYHPIGLALVTEVSERTGRALAVNGVFGNLGLAAAAAVAGLLSERWGWRSAWAVPGIAAVIAGSMLLARRSRADPAPARERAVARGVNRAANRRAQRRVFAIVCVSALFGGLVFNAITVSLPKLFDERLVMLHGDLGWVGASAGLVFAVAAFAQLPVGELLDRFGARVILISLLVPQIALLVLLSQAQGWAAWWLAMLLVTLLFAEIPVTSWLLGRYVEAGRRSRALSVEYILSLGVGSAVVPLIGWLHRSDIGFEFQLGGLAASAGIVLAAACLLPGAKALPPASVPHTAD